MISFFTSHLYALQYPEYLESIVGKDWDPNANIQLIYVAFYFVVSFAGVITSVIIKFIINRRRPIYATKDFLNAPAHSKPRIVSLSTREINTPAMPSADSTWGAIWSTLNILFFGSYISYIVIPMVMLGRVYYRCHWIGDTIVGTLIGILAAVIGFIYFPDFVRELQAFKPFLK